MFLSVGVEGLSIPGLRAESGTGRKNRMNCCESEPLIPFGKGPRIVLKKERTSNDISLKIVYRFYDTD